MSHRVDVNGNNVPNSPTPHAPLHRSLPAGRSNLRRHPRAVSLLPDPRYTPHSRLGRSTSGYQSPGTPQGPAPNSQRRPAVQVNSSRTSARQGARGLLRRTFSRSSRQTQNQASSTVPLTPIVPPPTPLLPENMPVHFSHPAWITTTPSMVFVPSPHRPSEWNPHWQPQNVVPIPGTGLHTPAPNNASIHRTLSSHRGDSTRIRVTPPRYHTHNRSAATPPSVRVSPAQPAHSSPASSSSSRGRQYRVPQSNAFTWQPPPAPPSPSPPPPPPPAPPQPTPPLMQAQPIATPMVTQFVPVPVPIIVTSPAPPGGYSLPPGHHPFWVPNRDWPPTERRLFMEVAPWLIPNPHDIGRPHVRWDISRSPETALRMTGRELLVNMEEAFDDVALYPPSHTAVIQYDLGSYGQPWGEINIEMDHDITCGDVFWTVYDFFQARLTQAEVDYLTNDNPANELMLTQNFARRCQLAPALFDYEYRQGFKRVDCLGGFKQWGGLSLVVAPDQSWELQLHLVPPSL